MNALRILLVGDVMLGRGVNELLRHRPVDYVWGETLPLFDQADFRICNLECALSDRGRPWPDKEFHFRADPKNVLALTKAKIGAVSLANNHTLDFGKEALADTLRVLDQAGIGHAGAGLNSAAALQPAVRKVGRRKIGLVAFTDNEPDWEAHVDVPGVAYVPVDLREDRATRLFETIQQMRHKVDILVVSAHWGPNWGYEPPSPQLSFAHRMIELGADVVYGHSGHVFRGVEIYRGRPVIYCAGNFIDDYAVDNVERNDESFAFILEYARKRLTRMFLHPTVIAGYQANLAPPHQAEEIANKMIQLSAKLGTGATWKSKEAILEIAIPG